MATAPFEMTPGQIAEKYKQERITTYLPTEDDGPIIVAMKWVYGRSIWHWPIERFVRRWLICRNLIDQPMSEDRAKATFNRGVEFFWLWWTFCLLLAYGVAFAIASAPPTVTTPWGGIGLFVLALGCFFRIVEIMAVSFRLHVLERYWTRMPAHALSLTFLAYFHAMLCFAVLYLTAGFFSGDVFNANQPISSGFLNAAYFSTVTIATIGYGDYAPTCWVGKLLVMFETFVGLLLLVVAIGRVLSATTFPPPSSGPEQGES